MKNNTPCGGRRCMLHGMVGCNTRTRSCECTARSIGGRHRGAECRPDELRPETNRADAAPCCSAWMQGCWRQRSWRVQHLPAAERSVVPSPGDSGPMMMFVAWPIRLTDQLMAVTVESAGRVSRLRCRPSTWHGRYRRGRSAGGWLAAADDFAGKAGRGVFAAFGTGLPTLLVSACSGPLGIFVRAG